MGIVWLRRRENLAAIYGLTTVRRALRAGPAKANYHIARRKGYKMFCGNNNGGCFWIIIILLLFFMCGGCGNSCSSSCCNNNSCCDNSCNTCC